MTARKVSRRPILSEEDAETLRVVAVYQACEGNASAAARSLGMDRRTVRRHVDRAARRGLAGTAPQPMPVGRHVERMTEEYARDPKTGEWVATRTWAKSRADRAEDMTPETFAAVAAEAIAAEIADTPRLAPIPTPAEVAADLATVVFLADLHHGLNAWGRQTGADYDLAVADRLIRDTLAAICARVPASGEFVILGLGDITHADDDTDATPAHRHKLDADTRHQKTVEHVLRLLLWLVALGLERHGRVRIRLLKGNHDPKTAPMLAIALALYFEGDDRVEVDTDPADWWFWLWGRVYLAANHGHQVRKPEDMPGIMATDRPDYWAAARFRYCHHGHLHHRRMIEALETPVECHRTPAARDGHHASGPWRSGRGMSAATYHRDRGEVSRVTVAIPTIQPQEGAANG